MTKSRRKGKQSNKHLSCCYRDIFSPSHSIATVAPALSESGVPLRLVIPKKKGVCQTNMASAHLSESYQLFYSQSREEQEEILLPHQGAVPRQSQSKS